MAFFDPDFKAENDSFSSNFLPQTLPVLANQAFQSLLTTGGVDPGVLQSAGPIGQLRNSLANSTKIDIKSKREIDAALAELQTVSNRLPLAEMQKWSDALFSGDVKTAQQILRDNGAEDLINSFRHLGDNTTRGRIANFARENGFQDFQTLFQSERQFQDVVQARMEQVAPIREDIFNQRLGNIQTQADLITQLGQVAPDFSGRPDLAATFGNRNPFLQQQNIPQQQRTRTPGEFQSLDVALATARQQDQVTPQEIEARKSEVENLIGLSPALAERAGVSTSQQFPGVPGQTPDGNIFQQLQSGFVEDFLRQQAIAQQNQQARQGSIDQLQQATQQSQNVNQALQQGVGQGVDNFRLGTFGRGQEARDLQSQISSFTEQDILDREKLIEEAQIARLDRDTQEQEQAIIENANTLGLNPAAIIGQLRAQRAEEAQRIRSEGALSRALNLVGGAQTLNLRGVGAQSDILGQRQQFAGQGLDALFNSAVTRSNLSGQGLQSALTGIQGVESLRGQNLTEAGLQSGQRGVLTDALMTLLSNPTQLTNQSISALQAALEPGTRQVENASNIQTNAAANSAQIGGAQAIAQSELSGSIEAFKGAQRGQFVSDLTGSAVNAGVTAGTAGAGGKK